MTFRLLLAVLGVLNLLCLCEQAGAVEPGEMLKDPVLEARARQLSQDLRCLVCQNQSIDDSNAPLAQDLRILLRERLSAGDSDTQAVAFLVSRYGNFVLLKPPFQVNTVLLWAGPALILLIAGLSFGWYLRKKKKTPDASEPNGFTEDDQTRLDELLEKETAI